MRNWLAELRKEKGLSQYAVADKANISQSYYSGIETGSRGKPLNVTIAKAIANALEFDWMLFYQD